MKVELITEGKIFKNHRLMCEELGIPFKNNTNSKKAQLKDLSLYCDWSKSGQSIVIKRVFESPLQKIENRGRKSIYGDRLQYLISKILVDTKEGQISISRGQLLVLINMVNRNYGMCSQYVKALSKHTSIEEKIIYDFFNTNNSNFKSAIEIALDNLMDKRLIMYSKVVKVCLIEESGERIYVNADKIEKQIIMSMETKVFKELGYKSIQEIRMSKDYRRFRQKANELIQQETDIQHYYFAYDITINEEYIEEGNNELLKQIIESPDYEQNKQEVNKIVKESIIKNAKDRHSRASLFSDKKMDEFRLQNDYINKINKLTEILIDDSAKSIQKVILGIVNEKNKVPLEIQEQFDEIEDFFM